MKGNLISTAKRVFVTGVTGMAALSACGSARDVALASAPQQPEWESGAAWAATPAYLSEISGVRIAFEAKAQSLEAYARADRLECEATNQDSDIRRDICYERVNGDFLKKMGDVVLKQLHEWSRIDQAHGLRYYGETGSHDTARYGSAPQVNALDELRAQCMKGLNIQAEGGSPMSANELKTCRDLILIPLRAEPGG